MNKIDVYVCARMHECMCERAGDHDAHSHWMQVLPGLAKVCVCVCVCGYVEERGDREGT